MAKVKAGKFFKRLLLLSLVLVLAAQALLYFRPLPTLKPVVNIKNPTTGGQLSLPWPSYGQAAIGAEGFGVLQTNGIQKSAPIASVAKIMTAYSVLKQKPLKAGEQGPAITISEQDVLIYNDYYNKGGSVARVVNGEKISQYQALQALLLPSSNNFADTLTTWAFSSMDKYIIYANQVAKDLKLEKTHISDASGFSPQTLSTAHDLVLLGQAALQNPVIAEIVAQQQATIPEAGTIKNTNWLLGMENVKGIKTGNTDEAMGCYLFASERSIGGQKVTLIGAIMGAPQLNNAITDSRPLINAADQGFRTIKAFKAGQTVGYYQLPWGGQAQAVAKKDLSFFTWQGLTVDLTAKLNTINVPQGKDAVVGKITGKTNLKTETSDVVLSWEIKNPSWRWRIFDR